MTEIYWRLRSKISEIFDKIPGLPGIFFTNKKFQEKLKREYKPCEKCFPDGGKSLPDDFNDLKLEKDMYTYNLKLPNIRPDQFKMLGRNLLNTAYKDPQYGKSNDDDTDEEEPLPPPPEPSEYMKNVKFPLVSLKATNIDVGMLEQLGDFFYQVADYMEMGENGKPMLPPPTDGTVIEEIEEIKKFMYDPFEDLKKDLTEEKVLSGNDLVPGGNFKPYQDDNEDWIELCNQAAPVKGEEDLEYVTI